MRVSLVVPKNLELGISSKGTVSERKQVRITGQENRNVDEDIVDVIAKYYCLYDDLLTYDDQEFRTCHGYVSYTFTLKFFKIN